jgi:uncharacterized protein (TIGR02145 family)
MMKTYKILLSFFLILMSGFGFSQAVPSYVPTNGLVGWWGFNGNAQDGSGNGNHGTVNGATLTTDRFGNQNGAYSFDGNDDFIQTNFLGTYVNGFAVSVWINSAFNFSNYEHKGIVYSRTNMSRGLGLIMQDTFQSSGLDFTLTFNQNGSLSYGTGLRILPNDGNWHLIVGTFMQSNNQQIYSLFMDGVQISTNSHLNSNPFVLQTPFLFGRDDLNGFGNRNWNGKLDDIGIWNRALTQQEITNLYNSQLPTQTSLCLPTITTSSPSSVGVDTVVIGGDISNDGGSSIVLRGICYSTSPNPNMGNQRTEDGSGTSSFNTVLRGLASSTTYYARSYAKNSNGVVVYGNEVSFTTTASLPGVRCPGTPTVTDIDGNVYNTVQIGNQCWTQSNLKVSKYRNGDNIPTGLTNSAWGNTTSGAYGIYNNDTSVVPLYGLHYNGYAVNDIRGICPAGWQVPTDNDLTTLVNFLGGDSIAGGHLKSVNVGFSQPNSGASNSSGFSGVAAGYFGPIGGNTDLWVNSYVWSRNSANSNLAWVRYLHYLNTRVYRFQYGMTWGFSVRCLKNTLPQVNTTSVTNVTPSNALVTGEVISDGGDQNTTRGFCYSTISNPTVSNDTTMNGTGLGVYSDTLLNLTPSTAYYVRAYATNSVGTSYGNEVSFTTDSIRIGSNYAGGIVFYIDSTGQHGLVCAPVNQVDFIYWGNPLGVVDWGCQGGNVLINNGTEFGTSNFFGAGLQNTINILNSCPYRPIAASLCHDLVLNGYSDWYLPSLNELLLMYNLKAQGIGNFNNFRYWSSSQHNQSLSVSSYYWFNRYAYAVDFTNGNYSVFEKTNQSSLTRAIRNF